MPDTPAPHEPSDAYEPPRLETLGTLADLTLGGSGTDEDAGFDFENSFPPS